MVNLIFASDKNSMSASLISIIVPCYNQAQYLDECLQSVLDQTYKNWECIIVNDGSPDHTEEVAMKWVEKDSRFHYFKKENGGVASARNFGIAKAKGDWILPLDGDDKINRNYLSLAAEKIKEAFDVIYCKAQYFGSKNETFVLKPHSYKNLLQSNTLFCSALFNKKKLNGIQYDEQLIHGLEDWDFWISYLNNAALKVVCLEETLFYYRIKSSSRNEDIKNNLEKDRASKKYILAKHEETYLENFGDYFQLLRKVSRLEEENKNLLKIKNSRKYKILEQISKLLRN